MDVETGAVSLLRDVVVSDCGRLINQMVVEGQIVGGVVHGIGNALLERMVYDDNAQPMTTNFGEYLLPSAMGLPPIEVLHHISPSPLNPLGVKGVGECGVIPAGGCNHFGNRGRARAFQRNTNPKYSIFPARLLQSCAAGVLKP